MTMLGWGLLWVLAALGLGAVLGRAIKLADQGRKIREPVSTDAEDEVIEWQQQTLLGVVGPPSR